MAVLDAAARNALPTGEFAIPETRSYPIHDKAHARDALSRVAANGTPDEKQRVKAAVHKKYPEMGESDGGDSQPRDPGMRDIFKPGQRAGMDKAAQPAAKPMGKQRFKIGKE
jgi:hypothetical protein